MNSKQRVHAALRREPVDRVPIFMWFHPQTGARLAAELEIPADRVAEAMGDDVRQAWVSNNFAMEGVQHERDGQGHVDAWGVQWVKEGPFNQIVHWPLADADENAVRAYEHPYGEIESLLANMAPVTAQARDYFIGADVSPCLFEMVNRLRGMEGALLDLAADRALSECMLDAACAFSVRLTRESCERFPLDWLWTGDDVAGQTAMFMSPDCWRSMLKDRLKAIFDVGAGRGLWVAYHSCGMVRPIIGDLIEIGLDVLNPIQCNCPGMDPLELKAEFGRDLAFMGGVDTQGVLPHGSADEVRRATERLVEGMTADGGGYILAASHTVPPETPLANIFAMYEAAGLSREEIMDTAAAIRAQAAGAN